MSDEPCFFSDGKGGFETADGKPVHPKNIKPGDIIRARPAVSWGVRVMIDPAKLFVLVDGEEKSLAELLKLAG